MGKFYADVADELILLARQWGWLIAIPKLKGSDGKETVQPARIEAYRQIHEEPPLPETDARFLFDWLIEVGPFDTGAMGQTAISWTTLRAWQDMTGAVVAPWQARALRKMSVAMLGEYRAAEDAMRLAPWQHEATIVDRTANERQLRSVLG